MVTNPTKVWDVLGLFLVASIGTWLLVRVFYGSLPPIPVYAGACLYLVAVVQVVTAVIVRNRIAEHRVGSGLHDLHPLTVFRALVLAKASMLVGTAVVGVCVGFLVYVIPRAATVRAASSDRAGAVVALVAGLAVVAAAVWLEQCCRTPEDRDDERSR